MTPGNDLEPVADTLDDVFSRLGLAHPQVMAAINEEWGRLAGRPWEGRSKPVVLRGKTLVVEASQPSMVAFLRYGEATLLETLAARFGEGLITSIEVVAPGRS
jgi:Dna[CI] antecedent, DciA